ncbi:MAG: peptidylprolyl isomerase [Bryobacteraceae bacterium]
MRTIVALAFCALPLFSQATKSAAPPKAAPAKPATATPAVPKPAAPKPAVAKPAAAAEPKPVDNRAPGLYGTMVTTMGTLKFELYEKVAPQTVRTFVELSLGRKQWFDENVNQMVRRPLYPGVTFHRVIPGFMIQAGDPTGSGAGNVGFSVPDEFSPDLKYDRPGRFGAANIGQPNTNSSQFFITEVPTPHLDGRHSIFGQVTENVELVGQIARVPTGAQNKPATPVKIVKITFERVGPVPPNAPEGAPVRRAVPAKKTSTATPTKKAAAPAAATKAPAAAPTKK